MSLFRRFGRAVRAQIGGAREGLEESFGALTRPDSPDAPLDPIPTPRAFAVGDRVICQRDGFCEITGRSTFEHDGLPRPVFELRSRRGGRLVPEARVHAVMRHVVGREGAQIARDLLLAEEPVVDPRPWAARRVELESALQRLDLGPEAQAVRALAARRDALEEDERTLFVAAREVVCDEIEWVLGLPAGSLADELLRRGGG